MKNVKVSCLCAALSVIVPSIASAGVIISDSFDRNGDLAGSAPDVAQTPGDTWTAATDYFTTSTSGGGQVSFNTYGTAALPFTPSAGNVYTLSFSETATGGDSSWLALGFLPNAATGIETENNMNDNAAAPWILVRGNGQLQAFAGAGTGNQITSGNASTYTTTAGATNSVQIILTTGPADSDTVQFVVDGTDFGDPFTYTGGNPAIASVGISSSGEPGVISDFTLSTPAPEPATLALVALGGPTLLRRRRA